MDERPRTAAPVVPSSGSSAGRLARDLHEQHVRDQATAQALRAHLARRVDEAGSPVRLTSASPASIREARDHARRRCDEHGVDGDRRDVLELAVSELVSNAVRHGRPPVSYDITTDGEDLVLVVVDADPRPPGDGGEVGPEAEGGRGLFLVAQLARTWGWEATADGKRVWVRV